MSLLSNFDYSNNNQNIVKDMATVFSQSGKTNKEKTKGFDVVCTLFAFCFLVILGKAKFVHDFEKSKIKNKKPKEKRATI
jgi:hypothetical protein